MKKMGKFMVTTLALITLLTACGTKKEESEKTEDGKTKVSFVWWGAEVRHEKYIKAIELFEEKNPDIDIEFEYSAWDDYWKKLATKSAAGELPDVLQMDAAYVAQYGQKNQLADLSELIDKEEGISTADIDKSLIDTARLEDKLYAIAPSMNAMSMLVNQKVLDTSDVKLDYNKWTFEDMAKGIDAVHKKTGGYGFIDVSDNSVLLQYYLRTKGEDLYKYGKDGMPELGFSKENFVTFMQTIQDLAKSEALPTAEVVNNLKSFDENPFSLGEAGLLQSWTNQYVTYQESAGDNVKFSLELPYNAKETGALYYRPTFYYSMAQTSKVKDEAAKFMDFIVNDAEAAKIFGTERGIPSNNKNKELLYPDMSETEKRTADYLTEVADFVGDASPVPPIGYSELNNHFKDLYAEITYATMTPVEAYDSFVDKAEEIFSENYND